jgi:hypothetical protein
MLDSYMALKVVAKLQRHGFCASRGGSVVRQESGVSPDAAVGDVHLARISLNDLGNEITTENHLFVTDNSESWRK